MNSYFSVNWRKFTELILYFWTSKSDNIIIYSSINIAITIDCYIIVWLSSSSQGYPIRMTVSLPFLSKNKVKSIKPKSAEIFKWKMNGNNSKRIENLNRKIVNYHEPQSSCDINEATSKAHYAGKGKLITNALYRRQCRQVCEVKRFVMYLCIYFLCIYIYIYINKCLY